MCPRKPTTCLEEEVALPHTPTWKMTDSNDICRIVCAFLLVTLRCSVVLAGVPRIGWPAFMIHILWEALSDGG